MVDSTTKHLHPHVANRRKHTLLRPSNEGSSSVNPLQVLQGVHAKVKGRGRTERLTRRGRGQGEVKIVCVAAEVSVCVGEGGGGGRTRGMEDV